jgi:two-component system, response regulator
MSSLQHVLVVEDNDEDFETVMEAAQRTGIFNQIRRATSGSAGLRMLRECLKTHDTLPALVLLDLNTPGDDGRYVLGEIKKDEMLRNIPTVVLSTSASPRDVDFCYAGHANAYHVKPVNHATHLKIVQEIFSYWLSCALLPPPQALEKQ